MNRRSRSPLEDAPLDLILTEKKLIGYVGADSIERAVRLWKEARGNEVIMHTDPNYEDVICSTCVEGTWSTLGRCLSSNP